MQLAEVKIRMAQILEQAAKDSTASSSILYTLLSHYCHYCFLSYCARVLVRYSSAVDGDKSKYSEIWLSPLLMHVTTFVVSQKAVCHIASTRTSSIFLCFLELMNVQCQTTFLYPHSTQVCIGCTR